MLNVPASMTTIVGGCGTKNVKGRASNFVQKGRSGKVKDPVLTSEVSFFFICTNTVLKTVGETLKTKIWAWNGILANK